MKKIFNSKKVVCGGCHVQTLVIRVKEVSGHQRKEREEFNSWMRLNDLFLTAIGIIDKLEEPLWKRVTVLKDFIYRYT